MLNENYSETVMPVASQFSKERDYWLNQLSGHLVKVGFPHAHLKQEKSTGKELNQSGVETVKFEIPGELLSRLMKMAGGSDARLHIILTAGIVLLLNKYTYGGSDDIIVGVPIYRQEVAGRLVNTVLALRIRLADTMTFKDLLLRVNKELLDAVENQNYPIQAILYHLGKSTEPKEFPLFEVTVLLENIHDPGYLRDISTGMKFSFSRDGEILRGTVEYDSLKYEKNNVEKIIHHLLCLLQNALADVKARISVIPQLSDEEKKQLLIDGNQTAVGNPHENFIHRLFEEQVEKAPDRIALLGTPREAADILETPLKRLMHVSYRELNEKSGQLADLLRENGVLTDNIVGIMAERSVEMIAGILGILKAGGAYLPIDPAYPEERINYMLADSKVSVLLTAGESEEKRRGIIERMDNGRLSIVDSQRENNVGNRLACSENHPRLSPAPVTSLAYIIYTSGTTGRPKGVMIRHRNVVQLLFNDRFQFDFSERETWTLFHSYCFDFSVWEMYGALLYGGKLIVIPRHKARDIDGFLGILIKAGVTVLNQTPSAFYTLINEELENRQPGKLNLKYVILGGEALSPGKLKNWQEVNPATRLINMYGITETTVHVTYKEIKKEDIRLNIGNIGNPLSTYTVYILDKNLELLPAGLAGELCVGGCGVARGYLNRPELTHERFLLDRFPNHSLAHSTFYRSGDLARWIPGGEMEYLGRIDHQVKIRGYRIELGEIENRLLDHETVKEAVVTDREDGRGEKYLCAYIVLKKAKTVDKEELRTGLADYLPDFMVPSHFVEMEAFPLTPNGKIDTKALPEPEINSNKELIPPRDIVEETLLNIWTEILIIKKETKQSIGIDTDFFQLGGHSLTATILINRIHRVFDVKVPLSEVFTSSTIRELAQYIRGATRERFKALEPVEEKEYYALSSAQKRLYILQQMDKTAVNYNVPIGAILEGELDLEQLRRTFRELVRRHESLRTSFHLPADEPVQIVHAEAEFEIENHDLNNEERAMVESIIKDFARPFDLTRAPLLRVGLLRTGENRHLLMIDMHHIVTDGISMEIAVKEMMALYAGYTLPPLKVRYRDFSEWQNSKMGREAAGKQQEYWLKEFAGELPSLNLATDYPRPLVQSYDGDSLEFFFNEAESKNLKSLAADEDSTLFMVLLAMFAVLLAKLSGQEDIIIGTPIAARQHADLRHITGMFVNTLALRNFPHDDKTFREFLQEVKRKTLNAFENQGYPFEELVEKAAVPRDTGRNPLFDIMFEMQNFEMESGNIPEVEIPGLKLMPYPQEVRIAKFDLSLRCAEKKEKLFFSFVYCTKLFKKERIEKFARYFNEIISQIHGYSSRRLKDIEIISEAEKKYLLFEYNKTTAPYPENKTIHELFSEQAQAAPDRVALAGHPVTPGKHNGDYNPSYNGANMSYMTYMSYKELDEQSHALAYSLKEKGVAPDSIVALMVERSIEMIAGILGILKAGGAYMPIDPGYPQERIDYMLKDSDTAVIITAETISSSGNFFHGSYPSYSSSLSHLPPSPTPVTSLAYIIYTSGTTGKPKGVMIEHRNVVRLLFNDKFQFDFNESDTWTMFHSYCFDFSVWEMYGALLYGGKLIVIPRMVAREPGRYLEILTSEKVTVLNQTPSAFYHLMAEELKQGRGELRTRYVIFGGEALNPGKLSAWKSRYPVCKLINMFGITETTVHVTFKELNSADLQENKSNIGRPIPTLSVYILDKNLGLVPPGAAGEICVGGEGLGRGYLNRVELTREKFAANPYVHGERLYRSGDLGRLMNNGEMEYLGRGDQQVKIRGYRIEVGEIENRLLRQNHIKEAVVIVKEDHLNDRYLCAYFVSDRELSIPAMRNDLAQMLPDYMIPSYFVRVQGIPLTPNGKVNKKLLPEPEIQPGDEYTAPGDDVEKKLVEIWAEVLNIDGERICINANFFELGGHSLKATILAARIHRVLNVQVPLLEIFKKPTISGLSRYIKDVAASRYFSIPPVEKKEYYPLTPGQKRLWIQAQLEENQTAYNLPLVYQFEKLNREALERALQDMIKRHESLRTTFISIDGEPRQRIHDSRSGGFNVPCIDLTGEAPGNREKKTEKIIDREIRTVFDLGEGPLIRALLIHLETERYVCIITMHHIISDGWSLEVAARETLTLLNAYDNGQANPLPPLRINYKDFSQWQNKELNGENLNSHRRYWLNRFKGEIPVLELKTDFPRPAVRTFKGDAIRFSLGKHIGEGLEKIRKEKAASLFMILLSAVKVLLYYYTGQSDIVVGTPTAGREHEDTQDQVGFYLNILPLRTGFAPGDSYEQVLNRVKETTLGAYGHIVYPFDFLLRDLNLKRDTSRTPLFDVVVNLQEIDIYRHREPGEKTAGIAVTPRAVNLMDSKFDLTMNFNRGEESLQGNFKFNADLFKQETILRMTERFKALLNAIINQPAVPIARLDIEKEFRKPTLRPITRITRSTGSTDGVTRE